MVFFQTFFSLVFSLGSLMVCWWLFVSALDFLHPVIVFAFCAALIAQAIYLLRVPLLLLCVGAVEFIKWLGRVSLKALTLFYFPFWLALYCVGSGSYSLFLHPFKSFRVFETSLYEKFEDLQVFKARFVGEDEGFLETIYNAVNDAVLTNKNSRHAFLDSLDILEPRVKDENFTNFVSVAAGMVLWIFSYLVIYIIYHL